MTEGRGSNAVLEGGLDERLVARVLDAAGDAPLKQRVRAAVETVVDAAELDPEGTSEALWSLRSDRGAVERLEIWLGMGPTRSTLALGAAVQLARSELASAHPDLRARVPELLRWLEGEW